MKYLFLLLMAWPLCGQETLINVYQDSTQRQPVIAGDKNGNYYIVWNSDFQLGAASEGEICLQYFNSSVPAVNPELMVNNLTAGDQEKPAIALSEQGRLAVCWASFSSFEQIYDIKCRLLEGTQFVTDEFTVNQTLTNTQTNPDVAFLSDGRFVVAWDSWYQDGSMKGVYARVFNADGSAQTAEFQVNEFTTHSQRQPRLAVLPDDRVVVIWESWQQRPGSDPGYDLYGRFFSAGGEALSGEFEINSWSEDNQWYADIAVFPDTSFVVAWCSWEQDGSDGGIYARHFSAGGEEAGAEVRVSETRLNYQWLPKLACLSPQEYVVVWSSWEQDGSRDGVYAQKMHVNGHLRSFETRLNDYTDSFQWEPDIYRTPDGQMMAVWASWGQAGNDYEIVTKIFDLPVRQGRVETGQQSHPEGRSTSNFKVHVNDSTLLNGHSYRLNFNQTGTDQFEMDILDQDLQLPVVENFPIKQGEQAYYLSPFFDGLTVEFLPEHDLALNTSRSYFQRNSGTNLTTTIKLPDAGTLNLAPLDLQIIWGSLEKDATGHYVHPLDTAMNFSSQFVVEIPFKVWNPLDQTWVNVLVKDGDVSKNQVWEVGERFYVLTPPPYQVKTTDTHVMISNSLPAGSFIPPAPGDTIFVFTDRPLTAQDVYVFTAAKTNFSGLAGEDNNILKKFSLTEAYPNPFNPEARLSFETTVRVAAEAEIFNILGEKLDFGERRVFEPGRHILTLNLSNQASGLYFFVVRVENQRYVRKLFLLK